MYCLPVDDVCQWDKFKYELLVEPAEDFLINARSFELGTFNGLTYTYVWHPTDPMIFIDGVDTSPNARPKILKGK